MIIQLFPKTHFNMMDLIIEEQAEYYGKRNSHVIAYFKRRLEMTREDTAKKQADAQGIPGGVGEERKEDGGSCSPLRDL